MKPSKEEEMLGLTANFKTYLDEKGKCGERRGGEGTGLVWSGRLVGGVPHQLHHAIDLSFSLSLSLSVSLSLFVI